VVIAADDSFRFDAFFMNRSAAVVSRVLVT
jgi:hypothetical protein